MSQLAHNKAIKRIFITSFLLFIAAWLIPSLPWRPKRIEDYLKIYKLIFEVFRTYSMISTAATTLLIFSYFTITGIYNWRRQYSQSTRNQEAEQSEDKSENEQLWERIRNTKNGKIHSKSTSPAAPLRENEADIIKFMASIKVFEYLEMESLKHILKKAVLKSVPKGEKLALKKTDLVFVIFGSFETIFMDPSSKAHGLTVSCTRGRTLTSYSNVMRALAHHFNKTSDRDSDLNSIKAIAKEDSQVLILTEECFVQLANTSKLSVAHLTQVILSRFKRATIPIVFDYFNLTDFATSFLGYFIKKAPGFNNIKLTDLLNTCQEAFKTEEKFLKVILQYLIGSFDLDHTEFGSIESSLALLQSHIQIKTTTDGEIIQEIDAECRGAFLVLEGSLKISFSNEKSSKCIEASVGDFVGVISSFMGKCSSIQVSPRNSLLIFNRFLGAMRLPVKVKEINTDTIRSHIPAFT